MSSLSREAFVLAEDTRHAHNYSECCKVGQIKWSQSQGLLRLAGIRESFVEELTFELGCEKARRKAFQEEGSVGLEAASMGNSEESVQPEYG